MRTDVCPFGRGAKKPLSPQKRRAACSCSEGVFTNGRSRLLEFYWKLKPKLLYHIANSLHYSFCSLSLVRGTESSARVVGAPWSTPY